MARRMAIGAALAALTAGSVAAAADQVLLQLPGPAGFEYAGYYAALWQGYYRADGLDVEIKPGGTPPEAGDGTTTTTLDPMQEVADGRAQFGVDPAADLVIRAAQGQPLLLLAPIFQRSGGEIYYRNSDDYASPGALSGAKVGRLPASNTLDIEMATALRSEGIDPDKINSIPLQPSEAVAALAGKAVDAVPGSAWTFPWVAHEKGLVVKSINPADYRVEFYGDTLFTLRQFAAEQPETVRGFRGASLRGWNYALRHPDEIAAGLLKAFPHPPGITDAAGFTHYQAALAQALTRYPAVELAHSNPDRWNAIETSLSDDRALLRTADPMDFIYDPEAAARSRDDLRAFVELGAALLFAVAVAAWLGRRWWWRLRPGLIAAVAPPVVAPAEPNAALPIVPVAEPPAAPATAAGPAAATAEFSPPAPAEPQMRLPLPDLNAMLGRLERTVRQRLPRGATCRMSLLPLLWRCRADPQDVRRLVLDLASSAAADLGDCGELVIGTRNFAFDEASLAATPGAQLGEYVRVTVRDSGPGFSEDALDRIFDPGATGRPAVAAAAEALRAQGGFARVESAEGIGTAVHLYFPRAVESAARPGEPAAAAE
jgi:ABC-type nitrate/sulfonate/bicarbonate transport system substrate-binding protein